MNRICNTWLQYHRNLDCIMFCLKIVGFICLKVSFCTLDTSMSIINDKKGHQRQPNWKDSQEEDTRSMVYKQRNQKAKRSFTAIILINHIDKLLASPFWSNSIVCRDSDKCLSRAFVQNLAMNIDMRSIKLRIAIREIIRTTWIPSKNIFIHLQVFYFSLSMKMKGLHSLEP